MHTLLTTTEELAATRQFVKRPDRANTHRIPHCQYPRPIGVVAGCISSIVLIKDLPKPQQKQARTWYKTAIAS